MKSAFDNRLQNNLFPEMPASFKRGLKIALEAEGARQRRIRPWMIASAAVAIAAVAASLVLVLTSALKTGKTHAMSPDDSTTQATSETVLQPTPQVDWSGVTKVFQLAPDYALDHLEMPRQEQIAASILDFLKARGKDESDELWILGVRPFIG